MCYALAHCPLISGTHTQLFLRRPLGQRNIVVNCVVICPNCNSPCYIFQVPSHHTPHTTTPHSPYQCWSFRYFPTKAGSFEGRLWLKFQYQESFRFSFIIYIFLFQLLMFNVEYYFLIEKDVSTFPYPKLF